MTNMVMNPIPDRSSVNCENIYWRCIYVSTDGKPRISKLIQTEKHFKRVYKFTTKLKWVNNLKAKNRLFLNEWLYDHILIS